jgi:hypothetical protein
VAGVGVVSANLVRRGVAVGLAAEEEDAADDEEDDVEDTA